MNLCTEKDFTKLRRGSYHTKKARTHETQTRIGGHAVLGAPARAQCLAWIDVSLGRKKNNKEAKATKHANDLLLARTWLQACVGRSVQLERHSKLKSSPDSTEPCLGTRDQYSARDRGARSLSNTVTRHLLGFDATRRVWPQRWARPCWAARASRLAKRCRTRGRRERAPVDRRRALLRRPTSDGGSDCGLSFAAPVLEPVPLLRTNAM